VWIANGERIRRTGEKLDEEVHITVLAVKSLGRRRTEDLESANAMGSADVRDRLVVERQPGD
jgi:hypothetical protein